MFHICEFATSIKNYVEMVFADLGDDAIIVDSTLIVH